MAVLNSYFEFREREIRVPVTQISYTENLSTSGPKAEKEKMHSKKSNLGKLQAVYY